MYFLVNVSPPKRLDVATSNFAGALVSSKAGICDGVPSIEVCSMFQCTLLYVHSSIAIILMGKRELVALLKLSAWCLVMVERLFLTVL